MLKWRGAYTGGASVRRPSDGRRPTKVFPKAHNFTKPNLSSDEMVAVACREARAEGASTRAVSRQMSDGNSED